MVESRPGKRCQREAVVAVSTPCSHLAHIPLMSIRLAGRWLRRKGRAPAGGSELKMPVGVTERLFQSSPFTSIASNAVCKPRTGHPYPAHSDARAHLGIFVLSACHDLPIYFPLWGGVLCNKRPQSAFFHVI